MTRLTLAAAGALLLAASPVLAQTTAPQAPVPAKVQTAAAPAGSEEWLRQRGESYSAAPDAEQDPAEVAETVRLNAEIVARNAAAERAEAIFEQESAQWREETARLETQRVQYEADLAASNAARAAYERAHAQWEAEVAACERARRVCVTTPPAKY